MMDVNRHSSNPLTDLVTQQARAISELLAAEAAVRQRGKTEQELIDAQLKVAHIAHQITLALKPKSHY